MGFVIITFVMAFFYFLKLHGGAMVRKCQSCNRTSNNGAICKTCTTINVKHQQYLMAVRQGDHARATRLRTEILRLEANR